MLLRNATAGPSRRLAPSVLPTARSVPARTFLPMFSLGMRAASTQAPAPPQAQRAGARAPRLTTEQWPWYPVDPPLRAGHTEEERVIYARPPTVSPKVYWAAAGVCISGFVMYFTIPSVAEARALLENPEDEREMMGMKVGSVMGFLSGGAMLSFLGIGILGLTWPSRVISRLSLVRSRPAAGSTTAETTTFIRMQHQGHEMMWGRFAQPRDIPLEQVCVKVILGRPMKNGERERLGWLGLHVSSPNSKRPLSFDRYDYRMDFRHTPALDQEKREVVMSIARLEDVFGPLSSEFPKAPPQA